MPAITVSGFADRWTAEAGGEAIGDLLAVTRPDGRCFLLLPPDPDARKPLLDAALAELDGPLYAVVDEADTAALRLLAGTGFVELRREGRYEVPIGPLHAQRMNPVPARPVEPDSCTLISAADADLDRLRTLDERLREDIPGGAGWRWTPEQFRAETFGDPAFDPRTYLVAVERGTGDYVGLLRVWMRADGPRLGCLAVLPAHRRTRVTAALLGRVLAELAGRGHPSMVTEVDDANSAARALLARAGARRTGTDVELARP